MKSSRSREIMRTYFLLVFLAVWVLACPVAADKNPAGISTVAGKISFTETDGQRFISHKGKILYTGGDRLEIFRFFRLKGFDAILVRDFIGPIACPVRFVFFGLRRGGPHHISRPFGNCDDKPEISVKKQEIIIKFHAFGSQPAEVWVFDGQELHNQAQ